LCGPWQHQAAEPPSKRPIGTDGTVGTDTIIGTVAIIGIDTIIGARITVATIITTGIPIIGNKLRRRSSLRNTARERLPRAVGFSINNTKSHKVVTFIFMTGLEPGIHQRKAEFGMAGQARP
jgi:hypothetical protein